MTILFNNLKKLLRDSLRFFRMRCSYGLDLADTGLGRSADSFQSSKEMIFIDLSWEANIDNTYVILIFAGS
jgi:hypothetical protein